MSNITDIELQQKGQLHYSDKLANDLPDYVVAESIRQFLYEKDKIDSDNIASQVMMSVSENSPVDHKQVTEFIESFVFWIESVESNFTEDMVDTESIKC